MIIIRAIKPQICFWQSSFHCDRRTEIVLTWLRISYCRLMYGFIFDGGIAPMHAHRDSIFTVEHILVHYTRYVNEWCQYHLDGKTISEVLGDINTDNILGYMTV